MTFREPGELAAVLLALATADFSSVPKFAAARAWLAANPAPSAGKTVERVAKPLIGLQRALED